MRGLEVWSRGIEWLLAGWLAAAGGVWAVPPPGYEPADEGHLDFVFCYVGGVWSSGLIWDRTGNPVHGGVAEGVLRPAAMVPVVARDEAYATGSRSRRPAGEEWEWVARHFQPERWWEPVSLEMADADGDSISNLMEYACGLDPRRPDLRSHERGSLEGGLPGLETDSVRGRGLFHFPMRTPESNSQVVSMVESCAFSGSAIWSPEWSTEDSSGGGWAAMAHSFDLPPWGPADRGFRLVVTLQDAIDYGPF